MFESECRHPEAVDAQRRSRAVGHSSPSSAWTVHGKNALECSKLLANTQEQCLSPKAAAASPSSAHGAYAASLSSLNSFCDECECPIITKLGSGTFGVSYEHVSHRTQRHEAVKVQEVKDLPARNMTAAHVEAACLSEARLHQSLCNENILVLHAIFLDQARPTPIHQSLMELCLGGTLAQWAEFSWNTGGVVEEGLRQIVEAILKALDYLHGRNIVHLDIKPDNVLWTYALPFGTLRVADFGQSITLKGPGFKTRGLTGTPGFRCPEIVRDDDYDGKADIFSLGILLFAISSDQPHPFQNHGTNYSQVEAEGRFDKVVSSDDLYKIDNYTNLSPELRLLVESLLEEDPDNRPSASAALNSSFLQPPPAVAAAVPVASTRPAAAQTLEGFDRQVLVGSVRAARHVRFASQLPPPPDALLDVDLSGTKARGLVNWGNGCHCVAALRYLSAAYPAAVEQLPWPRTFFGVCLRRMLSFLSFPEHSAVPQTLYLDSDPLLSVASASRPTAPAISSQHMHDGAEDVAIMVEGVVGTHKVPIAREADEFPDEEDDDASDPDKLGKRAALHWSQMLDMSSRWEVEMFGSLLTTTWLCGSCGAQARNEISPETMRKASLVVRRLCRDPTSLLECAVECWCRVAATASQPEFWALYDDHRLWPVRFSAKAVQDGYLYMYREE